MLANQFAAACIFVSSPPAQVEASCLVTAGHGPLTSGLPVRGHASHAQSRRCRSGHDRHGVGPAAPALPLAMSLTDRAPARSEGNCCVGLGSPRPLEPLVASAASLPTGPRRDPEVTSSGHGRHGAWPAARAPTAWHAGIARAWKARLRCWRAIAVGHGSPGPLEPLVKAPLRC